MDVLPVSSRLPGRFKTPLLPVPSPAKLAEQVDVLFTMLAHPDAVEQAALGVNGFLNHLRPNALWVDCSPVNPSFSKKMAAEAAHREIHFVDAPVTGSSPVAAEAKLIF